MYIIQIQLLFLLIYDMRMKIDALAGIQIQLLFLLIKQS